MRKESMFQKIARILISNLTGVLTFLVLVAFGSNFLNGSVEGIEYIWAILIFFLIFIDIQILRNKL